MTATSYLSPSDLGLPSKFTEFRPAQLEALEYIAASNSRFIACGLPTGSGKSALAIAAAKLLGMRAVYLTATKGLQDQVAKEFSKAGVIDIRGRNNYNCPTFADTCDKGIEDDCDYATTALCPYTAAVEKAKSSPLTVTNYAYWLHARGNNSSALEYSNDPIELLICDEAHEAPEQLASYLRVEISAHSKSDKGRMPNDHWQEFALERMLEVNARMVEFDGGRSDTYKELEEERRKYIQIQRMDDNWVWQSDGHKVWFDVIWPGQYAKALWSGVGKVLLMSATLRPYTLSLLGLKRDDYDFKEWPAVFQPARNPVYHIPTAKLTWKSTDEDYANIIRRMDEIISLRSDRRGIIQTISYERARRACRESKFADRMLWNSDGRETNNTLALFRSGGSKSILVSPSFKAGYDFPLTECEYQIILKTPYPDTSSAVEAARCEVNDGDYRMYVAMQDLVQMCGRGMRSSDDRCETFIIDNGVTWLLSRGKKHSPGWFKVWTVNQIPPPAPKL